MGGAPGRSFSPGQDTIKRGEGQPRWETSSFYPATTVHLVNVGSTNANTYSETKPLPSYHAKSGTTANEFETQDQDMDRSGDVGRDGEVGVGKTQ